MKRKISLLLAMCMLITCLAGISFTASAMEGTGTESDPYIITTQEEFQKMTGTNYYKLSDDITFNAPVAISQFNGVFDGNGKTITLTNATNGLIASLSGTVKNLTIDGAVTLASVRTGVVANLNFGTITNCKTTDTFVLNANGGQNGIFAGQNYSGTISYCINYGAVNATASNIGGITGHNYQGTVENCGNHGFVTSTTNNVAGIVGRFDASTADADGNVKGLVSACYNAKEISGGNNVGGIVGIAYANNSIIEDCFNSGDITATLTGVGGILGSNVSGATASVSRCYNTGAVTASSTSNKSVANAISGTSAVALANCYYNTTATGTPKEGSSLLTSEQMSNSTNFDNWDFVNVWQFNEAVNNSYKYPQLKGLTFSVPYPEGTVNNPIKISSQEDFEAIKAEEGLYYIVSESFEMTAPKTIESFAGVLLGNNKTITIKNGVNSLFKTLSGIVKDLTTAGDVHFSAGTSSVYAGTNNGTITNCKNYTTVNADNVSYVGVFAGKNGKNGTKIGTIAYCINYATCNFSGNNSGGIVGYNNYGTIEYCGNQGILTAGDINLGGIVGRYDSGSVSKCYNIGEISGTNNVGGIAGFTLNEVSVSDCFNKGKITGSTNALSPGGIIGGANDEMYVVNCYNAGVIKYSTTDKSVTNAISADSDVACTKCYFLNEEDATGKADSYPLTSEEMKNTEKYSTNFEGFDFANVWTFVTVESNSYKYPQIKGITFEIPYKLGEEGNPILITNATDFKALEGADEYFRINADNIELTGEYAIESFSGVLDGNGKTIIITNGTTPLFKTIESGAKVSNLTIEGNITFSAERFGAVAGKNKGTVYGVNNSAEIISNQYYSGGIVGENTGKIEECINSADLVFSKSNSGGIVGYNNGIVKACTNLGDIVNTAGSVATGGIVGISYASVSDCCNLGTISAGDGVGGIIGRLSYNSDKTISNCYNAGNVISSAGKEAGGIIGDVQITITENTPATIEVTDCFNQGAVMQIMSDKSTDWAIIGNTEDFPLDTNSCFYLASENTEEGNIQGIVKAEFDTKVEAFDVTLSDIDDIKKPSLYDEADKEINILSVLNNYPNNEYIKAFNKPVVLSFANISYGLNGYALAKFGFVVSKTDAAPETGKADCYDKVMEYINPKGNCSIMAYGSYVTESGKYYVRPYAVYSYLGEETTVYGDAAEFTAVVANP